MAEEEETLAPTWEGEFVDGLPSGKGVMTYPGIDPESPKDVYEGEMLEGKKDGTGKYTFANGGSYEGRVRG